LEQKARFRIFAPTNWYSWISTI